MKKFVRNKTLSETEEAVEDVQITEKLPEELHQREKIAAHKLKKTHKQQLEKPNLGITQKLNMVSHRTLATTERFIKSLSKAYEHIFVGDEKVEGASYEKEYGLKYYAKSDYKNALKHFESYKEIADVMDVDVLYMMGNCYVSEEDFKNAAVCFEKADELKPNDFDIVSQLAKCLLALEDFDGALNYFNKSSELTPDEADTYYHCANCYEKLDQIEQAKKMYRKAIDLNPREAVYYHALGFLYENIGDHKDAIVCFKKAMDLERARE